MQRKKTFLVVCVSILMMSARGQVPYLSPVDKIVPDHLEFKRMFMVPAKDTLPPIRFTAGNDLLPIRMTAGNDLGFFCKKELEIQRALRMPIFFRLGSLEYCNKLEGK